MLIKREPNMSFINNLKIRYKLQIPTLFISGLIVVLIILYFKINNSIETSQVKRKEFNELSIKIVDFAGSVNGYFNLNVGYSDLKNQYQELQAFLKSKQDRICIR